MSKVCFICGKKTVFGFNVSHAHNKVKRAWLPNLQKVRLSINGNKQKKKVCTSCISAHKTLDNISS